MIFRLALKNIIGNGWRSLVNMLILTLVLIGLIWMQAMYYSWIKVAETQQKDWEYASGMLRVTSYDPFDAFSWDKSHALLPASLKPYIANDKAVPVLLSPATIYPQGRMMSAMVKGIPAAQKLLKFPATELKIQGDDGYIPAIIGASMGRSSRLSEGDSFSMRIKDMSGAFNALDLQVVKIVNIPVPTMDIGTVWIDLAQLQEIKQMPDRVSYIVFSDAAIAETKTQDFRYIAPAEYFADLYSIRETERGQEFIMYGLMLFLAMIAVFDSQALAVFKRRREIGTLTALGMTQNKIAMLFTAEGVCYMLFATVGAAVLGFPLFYYFAISGYKLPTGYEDFGMIGFSEPIYFSYPLHIIFGTIIALFALTAFVSWLPTRKIARLNPTDALRGKVN